MAASPPARQQIPFTRAVAIDPAGPADQQVVGRLCLPPGEPARLVQVLVSGATYGAEYWDFPVRPEQYSYVRAMAAAGIATLVFDRVGIGASSHPPAEQLTVPAGAHVVHQLVAALRAGELGPAFEQVMTVGHSLGSVMVSSEAAQHHDVDAVVITGLLHHLDEGLAELNANLYPAENEPERFPGLSGGYLTTLPDSRGRVFYHLANADDDVIAHDEATKQTFTEAEAASFPVEIARSTEIDVPALVVVGDLDTFFCTHERCSTPGSGGAANEADHWAPGLVTVETLPDAGHDLGLQRNAPELHARIVAWTRETLR